MQECLAWECLAWECLASELISTVSTGKLPWSSHAIVLKMWASQSCNVLSFDKIFVLSISTMTSS